jgi:hypothetical protein
LRIVTVVEEGLPRLQLAFEFKVIMIVSSPSKSVSGTVDIVKLALGCPAGINRLPSVELKLVAPDTV